MKICLYTYIYIYIFLCIYPYFVFKPPWARTLVENWIVETGKKLDLWGSVKTCKKLDLGGWEMNQRPKWTLAHKARSMQLSAGFL